MFACRTGRASTLTTATAATRGLASLGQADGIGTATQNTTGTLANLARGIGTTLDCATQKTTDIELHLVLQWAVIFSSKVCIGRAFSCGGSHRGKRIQNHSRALVFATHH
jgi:hypothetical protein